MQSTECPEGFIMGRLPITEETKKKISDSLTGKPSPNKGVPKSEEHKHKISQTRKERKIQAWNKGLTAETDERVARNGQATKETRTERGNYVAWNKGLTKETDDRMKKASDNHIGVTAWNKGLTEKTDPRMKQCADSGRSEKCKQLRYLTKKKNGTFNSSSQEKNIM